MKLSAPHTYNATTKPPHLPLSAANHKVMGADVAPLAYILLALVQHLQRREETS